MNVLKRSVLTLALVAGVSAPVVFAQPPGAPAGEKGERRGPSAADRFKEISEALGLTEEQKTQIKPIVTEEAAALAAIWQDKSLSREASREKAKAVRDSFGAKIEALLTPEQKTKWEGLKKMRGMGAGLGGLRGERKGEDKK